MVTYLEIPWDVLRLKRSAVHFFGADFPYHCTGRRWEKPSTSSLAVCPYLSVVSICPSRSLLTLWLLSNPLLNQPKLSLAPHCLYVTPISSKHRQSSKSVTGTPRKSVCGYLWIELSQEFGPVFVLTVPLLVFDQIHTGKAKLCVSRQKTKRIGKRWISRVLHLEQVVSLACKETEHWTHWPDNTL